MKEEFQKQLIDTGFIHMPLKACYEKCTEARLLKKKVLNSRNLWDGKSLDQWTKEGHGEISLSSEGTIRMTLPARSNQWPDSESPDGDYAGFGSQEAILRIDNEDWQSCNRITCRIKPNCFGFHRPLIRMNLRNDGLEKVPDCYFREGFHDINLHNHEWNSCVWEFPDMPRDKITAFSFSVASNGKELFGCDLFDFEINDIRLEKVENPDQSLGWQGNEETVCFSTMGYWSDGNKTAIMNMPEGEFSLINEKDDTVVYLGRVIPVHNEKGNFGVLDFTDFNIEGCYKIKCNGYITDRFAIGGHIMEEALWKVINFLYNERCGYPVGGGHSTCHGDIIAEHNGLTLSYAGGWHDAGDLSQQTLQTAEITHGLFEAALCVKGDTPLYRRIVEEARWGLDFVIRMRFGDGYRATSAGIRRWTNGMTGDMDDEQARVHNRSFENFIMGGVEAFAAFALKDEDPDLAWIALRCAKEDYQFALERFSAVGMESCVMFEHTFHSSLSQYYAAASWSASQIFMASNEDYYAKEAERFADLMLACQETGDGGLPFKGFFYRDADKKTIVHFNHQAREHIFIQVLESLCVTQKSNSKLTLWENALRMYGDYLKEIFKYAEPFGMIPAGIHSVEEVEDKETFSILHLMTEYEAEKDNYLEQLRNGIKVDEKHYIRHFPVWFSFRGNTAVHLSSGKAASLIGKYFKDKELLEMAREQLYWIAGKNPFGQSLMYGEGSNYAQQYVALAGEMVGEMPVGIQTKGNEDRPYWPMANNATYKEVWTTSAGHWLWVVADLYHGNI